MTVPVTHLADANRFEAIVDDITCDLDYALHDGVMTILHTGVPAAVSGRGIAGDLTRVALDTARENGWRVVTACSYAAEYVRRHPDYADLTV